MTSVVSIVGLVVTRAEITVGWGCATATEDYRRLPKVSMTVTQASLAFGMSGTSTKISFLCNCWLFFFTSAEILSWMIAA